jgi:hypothetical protein
MAGELHSFQYLRAIVFCLSTMLIYLGLPLLGWGLDSFRDYFSTYSRVGYALVGHSLQLTRIGDREYVQST